MPVAEMNVPPPPPPISMAEMNIPPPPPPISFAEINVPPPPPPINTFPPGGLYPSVTPMAQLSAESEKLDREQDSLRDLRDKLIGARFTVAAKRKELRGFHIESGAKDGHAFNLLRQYLNEIGANVPSNISRALADASSLRDRLGLLEVEYDEAEASYNKLEWAYSRRETIFVEQLLKKNLVPSDTLDKSESADNANIPQLTRSMTHSVKEYPAISDLAASKDEKGTRSMTELSVFLAEPSLATPGDPSTRRSRPDPPPKSLSDLISVRTKSVEDFNSTHDHLHWIEKMHQIDEWLFDIVDKSPPQKLCLKAIHDFGFTDTKTWWEHTKWLVFQEYSTHFHTGDSTEGRSSSVSSVLESRSMGQTLPGAPSAAIAGTVALTGTTESSDHQQIDNTVRIPRGLPADTRREVADIKTAQTSRNREAAISLQKIGHETPYDRIGLPKRHNAPEVRRPELQETSVLSTNLDVTARSPDDPLLPILDPDSLNQGRKLSSHTKLAPHQPLNSEQSSSLAASSSKSPKTKESASTIDRYIVT
ncbi:unnamed protein product [Alternaria alternata]